MLAGAVSETPSRAELEPRLARLRAGLAAAGLDAALLVESADVYHLAGTAQNAQLIVPVSGEPLLLVRRDLERATVESALEGVEPLTSLRGLEPALARLGFGSGSAIGLELDVLPAASYLRYAALLPGYRLGDAMPAVWAARATKSPWELERVRAACAQGTAALEALPGLARVGRAEADVLSDLAGVMRSHGHEGTIRFRGLNGEFWFGQVLGGPSGAVPGPRDTPLSGPGLSPAQGSGPSRRPLAKGDTVVVDVSGLAGGYVSDQTRTVFVGDPDPRLVAAHEVCRTILRACEELLVPGTLASAVYDRGLEVADEAGLADHYMGFGHARVRFVGHAIGLELNEPPALARGFDVPLVESAVVAVEPKLVFPGLGAVGVENSYVVRRGGPERLTLADDDLPVLVDP
jgi:Xaa-Pro dipeptidase